MSNKYSNLLSYGISKAHRILRRYQFSKLVRWDAVAPTQPLKPGCTVLLGMCSKLPKIIYANLACLQNCVWDDLKAVYIIVDCQKCDLEAGTEEKIVQSFPALNIRFFYYTEQQSQQAERFKLPYLYAWMSWCIGLKHTQTQVALIHDYDALILSETSLKRRYEAFVSQHAKMQGISWYNSNGFVESDCLTSTFECFVDVEWLRSFDPIALFNNVGIHQGRRVDYDITLEIQANSLRREERTVSAMSKAHSEIVHPSQMIHQYTMFRKFPGQPLPCYAMILLPLFYFLAGESNAFEQARCAIGADGIWTLDGVVINLAKIQEHQLLWGLQQSVQTLAAHDIDAPQGFTTYYKKLYSLAGCALKGLQHDYATPAQQQWFARAQQG